MAERLLDDDPTPARVRRTGQAVLLELRDDDREQPGRDRQVERVVALVPCCSSSSAMVSASRSHAASSSNSPGTKRMPAASCFQTVSRHGVRAPSLAACLISLANASVAEVVPGEADEREARRQQPAVGEVVDGRDELLLGEVARDAEQDQTARPRDLGERRSCGSRSGLVEVTRSASRTRASALDVDRCSRSTGRPWSRSTWASPAACEAMNAPKVKSRPGTGEVLERVAR